MHKISSTVIFIDRSKTFFGFPATSDFFAIFFIYLFFLLAFALDLQKFCEHFWRQIHFTREVYWIICRINNGFIKKKMVFQEEQGKKRKSRASKITKTVVNTPKKEVPDKKSRIREAKTEEPMSEINFKSKII